MKAAAFDYVRPKDLIEAVKQLAGMPGEAKPLAGGQSLGPMLNLRLARPKLLVDVSKVEELKAISDEGDAWRIGASVTHAELEDRPLAECAPLAQVARGIAYRSVRTRGTLGGSLAHADPAGDWSLALAALGATIFITGPKGTREVDAADFTRSAFATVLADDEIIELVRVPKFSPEARWGYYKFCRKTGEFPDASAAVLLDPERRAARLYVGALDRAPQPMEDVAGAVAQHGRASDEMIDGALSRVAPDMTPAVRKLRATAVRRAIAQVA
jgi:carbon-monoxide dehydrogenase medium subunit